MKKMFFLMLLGWLCPLSLGAQDFVLEYRCEQTEPVIHKVKPQFQIRNNSSGTIDLSDFSLRYYFSSEGYVESILSIDYAAIGNSSIHGTFYPDYLEVSFSGGTVSPGESSGPVQLRIEKESHGNYIQENDYSFEPSYDTYTPHDRVTLYRRGTLVWGTEPPPPPTPTLPPPGDDDWLHTSGGIIVDKDNHPVRLTGINWFGFETNPQGLGGLQAVNWMDVLDMLASRGFNLIRLPLSLEIVRGWMAGIDPQVQFVNGLINPTIDGVSSLTLLHSFLDYCKVAGIKVMLDMHTLDQTDIQKKVWYNSTYSLEEWQEGWLWLAERFKDDDTVIAFDIFNEPHGQSWVDGTNGAKWDGSSDPNNWKQAAEDMALLIMEVNPHLLIMVEGIECTPIQGASYGSTDKYDYVNNWWGGNLREVADHPLELGQYQDQLVYSPHDYGPDIYVQPWFRQAFDMETLARDCWEPNWFFIVQEETAPVLIGEWGGKLGGDNQLWLESLAQFIRLKELNHTFWCFNPDSHDTGGIVDEDYTFDTAKYAIVEPTLWKDSQGRYIGLDHQVPLSPGGSNVALFYNGVIEPTPTPGPEILPGDADLDGVVNIVDALKTAQYYVGLEVPDFNITAAEVSGDGIITIVDALMIAQYYVGLIEL